jgi:c-di-AMP phosphodiesterase-like protein
MKKLFLIAGVIFTGLALSGCAKNNPANNYHSYKYYEKHKKQAKAVYKMCLKIPAFEHQNSVKFNFSKTNENCLNAQNVVYHEGNIFNKKLFNAMRRGER